MSLLNCNLIHNVTNYVMQVHITLVKFIYYKVNNAAKSVKITIKINQKLQETKHLY